MSGRLGGCLGLVALFGGFVLLVAASGLPWWVVVYSVVFWVVMRLRFDARRSGEDLPVSSEDGPRWSTMRGQGF